MSIAQNIKIEGLNVMRKRTIQLIHGIKEKTIYRELKNGMSLRKKIGKSGENSC